MPVRSAVSLVVHVVLTVAVGSTLGVSRAASAPWTSHLMSATGAGVHMRRVHARSLSAVRAPICVYS